MEGWNPLDDKPASSDEQIFELLTAAVFQARFRPAVVHARWPAIRRAFANFDLRTVTAWPDSKVAELMQADGMIRNAKKIRATLRNARGPEARTREFSSALAYLRSFGGDEEALVRDIDTWAHCIGAPSMQALGSTAEVDPLCVPPATPKQHNCD